MSLVCVFTIIFIVLACTLSMIKKQFIVKLLFYIGGTLIYLVYHVSWCHFLLCLTKIMFYKLRVASVFRVYKVYSCVQ